MKKVLLVFALLLIVIGAILLAQKYLKINIFSLPGKNSTAAITTVTINNYTFKVKVAKSQKEQEIGLSETDQLPQDQGMIFIFDKPDYYSFWMKNMKFPIDIIYINNDKIVTVKSNAQPLVKQENPIIYKPTDPTDKVLEINAGLSKKYNFEKDDKVIIQNL